MPKLKLTTIPDDKPMRLVVTFTGEQHRRLVAYAEAVSAEAGRAIDPAKLVPHIVERFIATDRAFARAKWPQPATAPAPGSSSGSESG